MTDTLPISQLPNGQMIQAASAAATINLDRCVIGANTPKTATFTNVSADYINVSALSSNIVSAKALFSDSVNVSAFSGNIVSAKSIITDSITVSANVSANNIYANKAIISAGQFSTVSASTPINVSSGGTGIATVSAYSVICGGTTNTAAFQGVSTQGTAGQVLTSNGANALPTWQAAGGGGGITLLNTINASGAASVVFSSTYITSTYHYYMVIYDSVIGSTGTPDLLLSLSTNNGVSYLTTGASGAINFMTYGLNTLSSSGGAASSGVFNLTGSQADVPVTLPGAAGVIDLIIQNGPVLFSEYSSPTIENRYIGRNSTSSTINNIKFTLSTGNITGNFHLYGISGT